MFSPSHIDIDDSLWPLLLVKFRGEPSSQELEAHLARVDRYLQRSERYSTISDTSELLSAGTAEQRKLQTDWIARNHERLRERLVGSAYIITSPAVRLAMSLVFHARPLPSPYLLTSNMSEAVAWAAGRMEEAGLGPQAERVRRHFGLLPAGPRPG